MANLKNNTQGDVKVRGVLVKPGQSVSVDEPTKSEKLMFGLTKVQPGTGRAAAKLVKSKEEEQSEADVKAEREAAMKASQEAAEQARKDAEAAAKAEADKKAASAAK